MLAGSQRKKFLSLCDHEFCTTEAHGLGRNVARLVVHAFNKNYLGTCLRTPESRKKTLSSLPNSPVMWPKCHAQLQENKISLVRIPPYCLPFLGETTVRTVPIFRKLCSRQSVFGGYNRFKQAFQTVIHGINKCSKSRSSRKRRAR